MHGMRFRVAAARDSGHRHGGATVGAGEKSIDTPELPLEDAEALVELEPAAALAEEEAEAAEPAMRVPRLDSSILRAVRARLSARKDLETGSLNVSVERGTVILEGIVSSDHVRSLILDEVSACAGVSVIRSSIRLTAQ